jgi:hypothetical protein
MRTLSTEFNTAADAQQTGEVFLTLLTIDYSGSAAPLRFVNNHESVVSNGDTYLGLAFNFTMPQDGENQRSAGIKMDNVDRRLSTFLLGAGVVDITVNEQLILISDPDTAEITRDYSLKNVSINRKTVSGELKYLQYLTDSFPTLTKTPAKFPGVF